MKRSHIKLSRLLLVLCLCLLSITGIALYALAPANPDDFPHPLNGLLRELHGASMAASLIMFGFMLSDHVQKKMAKHHHHWDGYLHLFAWIILIVSGLLLYYPQDILETIHLNIPLTHWYSGISLLTIFPLHISRKYVKRRYYQLRFHRSTPPSTHTKA